MKSTICVVLFALGLIVLGPIGVLGLQDLNGGAGPRSTFTLDVAVDCRTFAGGDNRGESFFLNGKILPAGTLPPGPALNDPARPLNGVAPIGDFVVRGQHGFPIPSELNGLYTAAGGDFATQYYIFNDGRALTAQGFALPSALVHMAVTGGIGAFRGAAGEMRGTILGTNSTGCPNSRIEVILIPGSVRGSSPL